MMRPLKRILFILAIAAVVCQVVYMLISRGLKKYYVHNNERMTELYANNTNYEILFLGSSRTHTGINPQIIDSVSNVNSYNAGVEGGNIFEINMCFEAYLQNHPAPKIVFLTIDLYAFNLQREFFNHTLYFPVIENKIIDSTLSTHQHNATVLRWLPFLALTEYDDYTKNNSIKGWMGANDIPAGDFQYKGYLSNTESTIASDNKNSSSKPMEISEGSERYLMNIINICKQKNIALIFTYAPEYKKGLQKQTSNSKEILDMIIDIALHHAIPLLRHDELDLCTNPKLFANPGHVNKNGANEYSRILGMQINELMQKGSTKNN